ncbi:hypothetical protein DFS34DRAFT_644236 [Phlyctochytrium arcticum]|nr:hypothetical protein DFS34DRAFT_644236 [Phlyctochytrium arcticum]
MADVYLRAADTAQSKAGPDEALSILSKGLRQFPLHRVLLNRKASLHIQAKQYGEALKAAEQLVKVKPSESPGYVHALTVFQTLGKTKSVIKICQAAINQISAKDPAYEVFVKELENRQEESSSRNESASRHQKRKVSKLESHAVPLQWDLPFELLTSVFSYLTFPALMKCAATCQTWRATIHKNKRFWSTLDLTSAPKVTSEAIQILLKRSGRSLRCLNLASCKHTGNGTLKGLVTSGCVALEDLDLSNTSKITFKTFPDYLKAFGRSLVQLNLSNTLADDVAIRRTLDLPSDLRQLPHATNPIAASGGGAFWNDDHRPQPTVFVSRIPKFEAIGSFEV